MGGFKHVKIGFFNMWISFRCSFHNVVCVLSCYKFCSKKYNEGLRAMRHIDLIYKDKGND